MNDITLDDIIEKIAGKLADMQVLESSRDSIITPEKSIRTETEIQGQSVQIEQLLDRDELDVLKQLNTPEKREAFRDAIDASIEEKLAAKGITGEDVVSVQLDLDFSKVFVSPVETIQSSLSEKAPDISAIERSNDALVNVRKVQDFQGEKLALDRLPEGAKETANSEYNKIGWTQATMEDVYARSARDFKEFDVNNLKEFKEAIYSREDETFVETAEQALFDMYDKYKSVESGRNIEAIAAMVVDDANGKAFVEGIVNANSVIDAIGADKGQFSNTNMKEFVEKYDELSREEKIEVLKADFFGGAYDFGVTGWDEIVTNTLDQMKQDPNFLEKPAEQAWDDLSISRRYLKEEVVINKTTQEFLEEDRTIEGRDRSEVLQEISMGELLQNVLYYKSDEIVQGQIAAVMTKTTTEVTDFSQTIPEPLDNGWDLNVGAGIDQFRQDKGLNLNIANTTNINTDINVSNDGVNVVSQQESLTNTDNVNLQVPYSETTDFAYMSAGISKEFDLNEKGNFTFTPEAKLLAGFSSLQNITFKDAEATTNAPDPTVNVNQTDTGANVQINSTVNTNVLLQANVENSVTPTFGAYTAGKFTFTPKEDGALDLTLTPKLGGVYAFNEPNMQFGEAALEFGTDFNFNDKTKLGASITAREFFKTSGADPEDQIQAALRTEIKDVFGKLDIEARGGVTAFHDDFSNIGKSNTINGGNDFGGFGSISVKIPLGEGKKNRNDLSEPAEIGNELNTSGITVVTTNTEQSFDAPDKDELAKAVQLMKEGKEKPAEEKKEEDLQEKQKDGQSR